MPKKPMFDKIVQVGVVVTNLEKRIRECWEKNGIGPWRIYTMDSSNVSNMRIHGQPMNYAMRVAMANMGGILLEIIEPLHGQNIYSEFLKEKGEGLHHVAFNVDNYDEAIAFFRDQGVHILQEGTWSGGFEFAYLDTNIVLPFVTEIFRIPKGWKSPPPEGTYP